MTSRRQFLRLMAAGMACPSFAPFSLAAAAKTFKDDWDYLRRKWREPCANPATGLETKEFTALFNAKLAELEDKEPWAVVKAKLFALCCDKTAIGVSPHDWFPAYASWHFHRDNPFMPVFRRRGQKLDNRLGHAFLTEIFSDVRAGRWMMWKDYCHSVPEWDEIIRLGFTGMRERLLANWKDTDYYRSRLLAADGVMRFLKRLADEARAAVETAPVEKVARLRKELAAIERLRVDAPGTAYEVLMFIYLDWTISENFDAFQVRSLSNLDRILTPFYRADLAAGRTTEEEFREQLRHFWWQWGSINNPMCQPVYFGGTKSDGSSEYNEVSKILLDIHDELGLPTPKVQLKVGPNTPDWVWRQTLDMARRQRPLVFCGEEPMTRVLESLGYTKEDGRRCVVKGCYEFAPPDATNDTEGGHVNLLKPVEVLLRRAATGAFAAETFGDFLSAYKGIVVQTAKRACELFAVYESNCDEINPSLMYSLGMAHSVESGKDAFFDGCARGNDTTMAQTGIGTTVDALVALKEIVYERREMTLADLGRLMAANWEGREDLRLRMLRSKRKWGNNDAEANQLADEIVKCFSRAVAGIPNRRGGRFYAIGHSVRQYIHFGKLTGATPDGRKAGEEMSKNISPTQGADTEGVTALLSSVAHLDARDLPGDFPLDVMLLPYTVAGDKGLEAMREIVTAYHRNGGCAIHFNVVDADLLKAAQREPEKYEGLMVRVCGWTIRWNDMPPTEQAAFIRRAEELAR